MALRWLGRCRFLFRVAGAHLCVWLRQVPQAPKRPPSAEAPDSNQKIAVRIRDIPNKTKGTAVGLPLLYAIFIFLNSFLFF